MFRFYQLHRLSEEHCGCCTRCWKLRCLWCRVPNWGDAMLSMADREAIRLTMILISQNGYNDMKIHEHRMDQWYTVIHKWLSQSWALLDHGFINLYALRLGNLQDMPFCLALQGKGGFHLFFAKKSKGIHWWKWDKWKFPAVSKLFAGMIQYLKASWSHGMAPQNRYYIYIQYTYHY